MSVRRCDSSELSQGLHISTQVGQDEFWQSRLAQKPKPFLSVPTPDSLSSKEYNGVIGEPSRLLHNERWDFSFCPALVFVSLREMARMFCTS